MMILDLPLPPPLSTYYGFRGKSKYISAKGKAFIAAVSDAVAVKNKETMNGRIAMFITIYPADRRASDLDNRLKALLDALTHSGAWQDDSQVDDLHIIRKESVKGGKCTVVITEIEV